MEYRIYLSYLVIELSELLSKSVRSGCLILDLLVNQLPLKILLHLSRLHFHGDVTNLDVLGVLTNHGLHFDVINDDPETVPVRLRLTLLHIFGNILAEGAARGKTPCLEKRVIAHLILNELRGELLDLDS